MNRKVEILLVEDDPEDIELTREAFKRCTLQVNLISVEDGLCAMEYLQKAGSFSAVSRPDLILLDLNMPRKGGLELLQEIKADRELQSVPVAILTTSQSQLEMEKCRSLGASCFITKPVGLEQFDEMVRQIEDLLSRIQQ